MTPDRPARNPDDDLDRLMQGAVPGEFSFFGRQKEQPAPLPTGIEPGRVLDDFKLLAPIGQGGMGQVWEAEQVSLNRRVALKLVRPDRVNEHALELFSREARAGGRLSHAGIVSVYGHGQAEGVAWISMELVEGAWTLKDFIEEIARKGEAPAGYYQRVAELMAELADALQEAHEANVIHRDLKPGNVLITPDEHTKVTDFGLAKITDETALSVTGDFAGTYSYMSPEQVTAKRMGLDHRTDIFSLGIIFYELLALRRPFEGDTSAQVAEQIVTEEPPVLQNLRSRIPPDLSVIAGKCLEKARSRRYQTMGEVAADIRRHLSNEPILAKPPTTTQRATKWVRRHPTQSAVVAVGTAALAVITMLLVKNVETNRLLRHERGQLMERGVELAKEIEDVGRLSAQKDLDDLVDEAQDLWPSHPENISRYEKWVRRAKALIQDLDRHRATLADLQSKALPQTEEERRLDREAHPLFESWEHAEAEWRAKDTALRQRRDGEGTEPAVITDWDAYPGDLEGLLALASPLVDPNRTVFGREGVGLRLCEQALELVESDAALAEVELALARAHYALGRDGEAAEALEMCRDALGQGEIAGLRKLEVLVRSAASGAFMKASQAELESLDVRRRDLEGEISSRRDWRFPASEPKGRWWRNQLVALIGELEELQEESLGLLGSGVSADHGWGIGRRLERARMLEVEFTEGGEYRRRWEEALPKIEQAYPGLDLDLQMGLVPLGQDPDSRLWEFWHVQSGAEPERRDGRLVIAKGTGIVLVLLRGGEYWMGSDPPPDTEAPRHRVRLTPFFLSKYELSSSQWQRATGKTPEVSADEARASDTDVYPLKSVSWLESDEELRRAGLCLPTEAQWEYGTRAGTDTTYWTGDDKTSLGVPIPGTESYGAHAANLIDQTAYQLQLAAIVLGYEEWLRDGFTGPAPVDSLSPNGFGLHHVHGNVREWCADDYDPAYYRRSPMQDPVCLDGVGQVVVVRGGSFRFGANVARSASRDFEPRNFESIWQGVRPARAITR